jgi:hypothetical protein
LILAQLGQGLAEESIPLVLPDWLDELDGREGMTRELVRGEGGGGSEYEAVSAKCFYGGGDC